MGRTPKFNFNEFKDWFTKQGDVEEFFEIDKENDNPLSKFVGHDTTSKVSKNKLLETIESASGDEVELIDEFYQDGGVITDVNGKNLCIKTNSGSFELPRFCVKVLRNF